MPWGWRVRERGGVGEAWGVRDRADEEGAVVGEGLPVAGVRSQRALETLLSLRAPPELEENLPTPPRVGAAQRGGRGRRGRGVSVCYLLAPVDIFWHRFLGLLSLGTGHANVNGAAAHLAVAAERGHERGQQREGALEHAVRHLEPRERRALIRVVDRHAQRHSYPRVVPTRRPVRGRRRKQPRQPCRARRPSSRAYPTREEVGGAGRAGQSASERVEVLRVVLEGGTEARLGLARLLPHRVAQRLLPDRVSARASPRAGGVPGRRSGTLWKSTSLESGARRAAREMSTRASSTCAPPLSSRNSAPSPHRLATSSGARASACRAARRSRPAAPRARGRGRWWAGARGR
jgi:hypothetical protein